MAKTFLEKHQINIDSINTSVHNSDSFSSVICISSTSGKSFIGCDNLVTDTKKFKESGNTCSKKFLYTSQSTVDQPLADMIIRFLTLSKKQSIFTTSNISNHLQTNLDLCKFITGMNYQIDKKNNFCYTVTINP